jgi:3'(2'), 5'-bisphosphate nucleotidase
MTNNHLLTDVINFCQQAGDAILKIYGREDFGITSKADASPLTLADTASHDVILKSLSGLTPDVPVLSEESQTIPYNKRKLWKEFWLVDPLDGTKEFIKRNGEFTVNVALIKEGRPVLGVVHAPVLGTTYYALKGEGAFKKEKDQTAIAITRNDDVSGGLKVVASRSHQSAQVEAFLNKLGPHQRVNMGSSLKFCLVAEGQAHLYPRFIPTMEWDTAAAQCVAEAAGVYVCDFKGQPLSYNKENLLNPFFTVSALPYQHWQNFLR